MREFPFRLSLGAGLRASDRQHYNKPGLVEAVNCEATQDGLVSYRSVVNPFDEDALYALGLTVNWPFPILFGGSKYTLVASRDAVYVLPEDSFELLPIALHQYGTLTETTISPSTNRWHCAYHQGFWILTNGEATIVHSNEEEMAGIHNRAKVQTEVYIRTVAYSRGRVLFGGFEPGAFWPNTWKQFFREWEGGSEIGQIADMEIEKNMIWWSSIGGGDVQWLFDPESMVSGRYTGHSNAWPLMYDYLRRGESGFMPMSWPGQVLRVLDMEEVVFVGGEGGLSILKPASAPLPTYGETTLSMFTGLAGSNSAAYGRGATVLVNAVGDVQVVDRSGKMETLGYREFLKPHLSDDIVVCYDEAEGRFLIGTDDQQFILNRGLTKVSQRVTSVVGNPVSSIGITTLEPLEDEVVRFQSDTIDMGISQLKTITTIEVPMKTTEDLYVSIGYRTSVGDNWEYTDWRLANAQGVVTLPIAGLEFRVRVKTNYTENTELPEFLKVYWALTDKRNTRGIYDNQIVAGTGQ
jgi:hypothetical protein